jgi:suppressor of ftsI
VPVTVVAESVPAVNSLPIPEVLEPTMVDGAARFDLSIGAASHDFGSGVATETISYNGQSVLGPTLRWATGDDIEINVTNTLAEATTAHWHGADVPAVADGGPHSRIDPGQTWTAEFPVIQPAATLWYHPHLMGNSAEQVYSGAAGLIIVDDDNPLAAGLPRSYGIDDIPVILQDREFTGDNQLRFQIDDGGDGDLNPNLTVNGTLDPFATVPSGPVRLRLLNGSQARVYELSTSNGLMVKIASDGGYLAAPVPLETLTLGPGERAEVIIDTTDGPAALLDADFGRVLELRTDPDLPSAGSLPDELASIDAITAEEIDRTFLMGRADGGWGINGMQMDMTRIDHTITFGDTERWTITVRDGIHTFHTHQTQFQILSINGQPPPPQDVGWKDTVLVTEDREVVIAARFDSYTNPDVPYMFHCHVLDHEALGMMGQFQVLRE